MLIETDATGDLSESAQAIKLGGQKITTLKFCSTRWTARVTTLSALLSKYLEVLEKIRDCSTTDVRNDATSYIRLSQFIVALAVSVCFELSRFCDYSTSKYRLQPTDAYNDVELARECIRDSQSENCWERVWNQIEQVASAIAITISKPRTARLQCH